MAPKNATRIILFAIGFLSIGTQIYLLREFMMVFNDNELIIGIVLASWMLITGIGSFFGRYSTFLETRKGLLVSLLILIGVLPICMISGIDVLKLLLVPYGSMADLYNIIAVCILVQLPFCLLNGFLFSFLSTSSQEISISGSYSWESLGSMVSGALINFLFLWILGSSKGILVLTSVYLMLIGLYTRIVMQNRKFYIVLTFTVTYIIISGIFDIRTSTQKMLYPSQQIISNTETPYGQVVVTKSEGQLNYFENNTLLFSSGNNINMEENVHYAMAQHPKPLNVLLISGGFSGTLGEILKYHPLQIDYVELNPSLVRIATQYTSQLNDPRVRVHRTDARYFIRNTSNSYDIVLVNLPPPSTLQLNRYYSSEFLTEIRKRMRPGAVIAYSLPTGGDYVSEQGNRLNAVLWNTLKHSFAEVLVLPAGRNYFLASDTGLSLNIPGLIQKRGIETAYVNQYYLDAKQLKERSLYVTKNLARYTILPGYINLDFKPVAAWYQISWWLSHFKMNVGLIVIVTIVILLFLLITLKPVSAGLFTGGFTVASTEIILIFALQVLCGYLFLMIGMIIMVFMLGLAAGALQRFRIQPLKTLNLYRWLQVSLALCSVIIPLMVAWMGKHITHHLIINLVIVLLGFSTAFILGMEYRMASLLSVRTPLKTVAGNYSADMFGSAAGAFTVSLFLIPSFGIVYTGIFMAILNLISAFSLFFVKR